MERFILLFYILLPINVFSFLPLNKHSSSLKMSSIESNNNKEATNDHLNSLYKGMSQLTSSTSTLNNNRQLPSPLNLIVDFNILRNSVVYEVSLGRDIGLEIVPGRNGLAVVGQVRLFTSICRFV